MERLQFRVDFVDNFCWKQTRKMFKLLFEWTLFLLLLIEGLLWMDVKFQEPCMSRHTCWFYTLLSMEGEHKILDFSSGKNRSVRGGQTQHGSQCVDWWEPSWILVSSPYTLPPTDTRKHTSELHSTGYDPLNPPENVINETAFPNLGLDFLFARFKSRKFTENEIRDSIQSDWWSCQAKIHVIFAGQHLNCKAKKRNLVQILSRIDSGTIVEQGSDTKKKGERMLRG